MINLSKSQSEIINVITQDSKTDESDRILKKMILTLGPMECRNICLQSLPITSLLNDDVIQHMLSFCHTTFLFNVMRSLNKKFQQLVIQTENNICVRKYSKLQCANAQRTFIISNIRKQQCDIENKRNFLGPFCDLHDVVKKATNNDIIAIIHNGKYVISDKRKYAEIIDKNLKIIGLTANNNDIEIIINNVQVIEGNVTFKNITLKHIMECNEFPHFVVYTYGHMSVDNCVFDFYDEPDDNGDTSTLMNFVEVEIGAFFSANACKFHNVSVAIEIDYRAYEVIIKNCIFENMWMYGRGSDSCILISDDKSIDRRMKILRYLHYPEDLTAETFSLKLQCEYNVFRDIRWKYPFMESLYYDTSNQDSFTIQHNCIDDEENLHDANTIYQIQLPWSPYEI